MTTWSLSAGPALQRQAEDVAALAGDLADRDPLQAVLICAQLVDLNRPQTARTVFREQSRLVTLAVLQQQDLRDGAELKAIGQQFAGKFERWNREQYEASKEKALQPATAEAPQRERSHHKDTTAERQLALDWSVA